MGLAMTVRWQESDGSPVDESTQREGAGDDAAPADAIRLAFGARLPVGLPGRGRARHRAPETVAVRGHGAEPAS